MSEIEISNGQNIIDLLFDNFASCLVIKKALAVNWPDCQGSIAEYYSISNYPAEERIFYTQTINKALSEGSDAEQFDTIREFLQLFGNGKYTLNKFVASIDEIEFMASNQVTDVQDTQQIEMLSGGFYPDWKNEYDPLVYTITNDKIDQNRVHFYCDLIQKGVQPTILTFNVYNLLNGSASSTYVLDGHHKIEAYLKLQRDIPIICITKLEECVNKTTPLLHFSRTILNNNQYRHLFENNDENLLSVDFLSDPELTYDLDQILANSKWIELGIINTLKKYSYPKNQHEREWIEARLSMLKKNRHISLAGNTEGLKVYEKRSHEKHGECWFARTLNTEIQLSEWITQTIKEPLGS